MLRRWLEDEIHVEGVNLKERMKKTAIFGSVSRRGCYKSTPNEKCNAYVAADVGIYQGHNHVMQKFVCYEGIPNSYSPADTK